MPARVYTQHDRLDSHVLVMEGHCYMVLNGPLNYVPVTRPVRNLIADL